jgi:hypothetical protein
LDSFRGSPLELKNEKGQTVVEYILLLAVSASLVMTFYRSSTFKKLFGDQGVVGQVYKRESEWGYRHAYLSGSKEGANSLPYTSAREHPSYFNSSEGRTRFFGPSDPYPAK